MPQRSDDVPSVKGEGLLAKIAKSISYIPLPTWLATICTAEEWLFFTSWVLVIVSLAVILFYRFPAFFTERLGLPLTRQSAILDSSGVAASVPLIRGPAVAMAGITAFLGISYIVFYLAAGQLTGPSVAIRNVEPSNINWMTIDNGKSKNKWNSIEFTEIRFTLPNNEVVGAYSSLTFDISINRGIFKSKTVRLDAVYLDVENVSIKAGHQTTGAYPIHSEPANRYRAKLSPAHKTVKAQPVDDENRPFEDVVKFDEQSSSARFHIAFVGEQALYRVCPIVRITDSEGKNTREIRHSDRVLIGLNGFDQDE